MTLPPSEFLRRYLQHVLPQGFHRVRAFGFGKYLLRYGLRPASESRAWTAPWWQWVRKLELPHTEQNTTLLELILEVDHQEQRVARLDIPYGQNFVSHIASEVGQCDALLVLMGANWLPSRLRDPHDMVRLEIEQAVAASLQVIPVLVDGARMPPQEDLPDSINAEYVMRRIREEYLTGTSCTIVLCGRETPRRKFVDWEIKATLDIVDVLDHF